MSLLELANNTCNSVCLDIVLYHSVYILHTDLGYPEIHPSIYLTVNKQHISGGVPTKQQHNILRHEINFLRFFFEKLLTNTFKIVIK